MVSSRVQKELFKNYFHSIGMPAKKKRKENYLKLFYTKMYHLESKRAVYELFPFNRNAIKKKKKRKLFKTILHKNVSSRIQKRLFMNYFHSIGVPTKKKKKRKLFKTILHKNVSSRVQKELFMNYFYSIGMPKKKKRKLFKKIHKNVSMNVKWMQFCHLKTRNNSI